MESKINFSFQNEPKKCKPYIIFQAIVLVLACIACIVLFPLLIVVAIKGYFFFVIYSYYQSMSSGGGLASSETNKNASGAGYQSTEYSGP